MILDEYRIQIVERLKVCREATVARGVVAEADLVLTNGHLTRMTQNKFWETLYDDLDVLGEEAKFMTDREAGAKLASVVVAAQARIAGYRKKVAGDQE